ncbi:MAG: HAD-IIIC family phosphatase [Planctomycetota bacterium]|nr:HAD-IIIC family phosphatase [Planctomycetota bacterium]
MHRILDEVHANPTIVNINRAAEALLPSAHRLASAEIKIGCLATFTFDAIETSLRLQALRAGIAADTFIGPFGRLEQELIDPASGLAESRPDVILLAVRLKDSCPAIYEQFNTLSPEQSKETLRDWHDRLAAALRAFRVRSNAHVLIHNYEMPAAPALGLADRASAASQVDVIARANDALTDLASAMDNVRVMDYDGLVANHGRLNWTDSRLEYFARMAVAPRNNWHLAGFYIRHLRPLVGPSRKVLVLDADNTLWGGVVGDVGLNGIELGGDYPGNAYVAFQRRVLDLYHRGVVLCLASKNESGTVEEVLDSHPDMVLRREHFAAMRVNWDPKPANVERIATDLNLGIDSMVFLDDSPVECELMRTALPQVLTIQMPPEPAAFPGVIESLDCFDQWSISAEDRRRGSLYKADTSRRSLKKTTVDMPTFLRQLEMTMTIYTDHAPHAGRAAQLTNRTNQFNMHTVRCTENDIRTYLEDPNHHVFTLALADRFGDSGIVGLAVVRCDSDRWVLLLFLMSCRVLGRTVEQGFVAWIARRAREGGAGQLIGQFLPTAKNRHFADFYKTCGFSRDDDRDELQAWAWDLQTADPSLPDWLQVIVSEQTE